MSYLTSFCFIQIGKSVIISTSIMRNSTNIRLSFCLQDWLISGLCSDRCLASRRTGDKIRIQAAACKTQPGACRFSFYYYLFIHFFSLFKKGSLQLLFIFFPWSTWFENTNALLKTIYWSLS